MSCLPLPKTLYWNVSSSTKYPFVAAEPLSVNKPFADKVRLVPEDSKMKDHGFYYYAMKPTKGEKKNNKLRLRKFDPITKKHIWWVEKKLPPHSK